MAIVLRLLHRHREDGPTSLARSFRFRSIRFLSSCAHTKFNESCLSDKFILIFQNTFLSGRGFFYIFYQDIFSVDKFELHFLLYFSDQLAPKLCHESSTSCVVICQGALPPLQNTHANQEQRILTVVERRFCFEEGCAESISNVWRLCPVRNWLV